jgi:hypothetical protein
MRIVELSREDVANTKTKKDLMKLLREKYDAAREEELEKEIFGRE